MDAAEAAKGKKCRRVVDDGKVEYSTLSAVRAIVRLGHVTEFMYLIA